MNPPDGFTPLPPARLVRLAAATSQTAAASGRLELYPRRMPALRALKLAAGAFLGVPKLSVESIVDRLLARYPEAHRLPGRPQLDELLREAGLDLTWDHAESTYRQPTIAASGLTSSTVTRLTAIGASPAEEEARQFEDRLRHAAKGGYLLLVVEPRDLRAAEAALVSAFAATTVSIESVFLAEMKKTAAALRVDWDRVVRADAAAADSREWRNVLMLAEKTKPAVEAEILTSKGITIATRLGVLARYGQVDLLERLRDRLSRPRAEGPSALWVLAVVDDKAAAPILDGVPIPVVTPNEWLRIPHSWVRGRQA